MVTIALPDGYQVAAWESFATAEVAAAAALAGLLVVACSINIGRIIELPSVVARMAAALALFTGVLMAGTVLLVPGQGPRLAGGEVAFVGLAMTAVVLRNHGLRNLEREYRGYGIGVWVLALVASLLVAAAGVQCAAEIGGGLYWLVPGVLLAFAVGLGNAWVALVEILR